MKDITFTANTQPERKLRAVLSADKRTLWLNRPQDLALYRLDVRNLELVPIRSSTLTLRELAEDEGHTPIYEGDSVTINF